MTDFQMAAFCVVGVVVSCFFGALVVTLAVLFIAEKGSCFWRRLFRRRADDAPEMRCDPSLGPIDGRIILLKQLVQAQDAYLKLTGEEHDELAKWATVHGWRTKSYEAGKAARAEIDRIRKKVEAS